MYHVWHALTCCHHPSLSQHCLVLRSLHSFLHTAFCVIQKPTQIPPSLGLEPSSNFHLTSVWFPDFLSASVRLCLPLQLPSYQFLFVMFWPDSLFWGMLRSLLRQSLAFLLSAWCYPQICQPCSLGSEMALLRQPCHGLFLTWLYVSLSWSSPEIIYIYLLAFFLHKFPEPGDSSGWLNTVSPVWHQAVAIRRWSVRLYCWTNDAL